MSLQLTLYPQKHEGQYTWQSTANPANLVSDPTFFFASNSYFFTISDQTSSSPIWDALNTYHPVAAWIGFRTTGGVFAGTDDPSSNGYILTLPSTAPGSYSGVYQRVLNLTQGVVYDIDIYIKQEARGVLFIGVPGQGMSYTLGTNTYYQPGVFSTYFSGNTNTNFHYTQSFTAPNSSVVLPISFYGTQGDDLEIWSVSVKQSPLSLTFSDVSDGQVVVDLYDHKPVPMTLSVDDFKKMAEKPQSYSKSFNLPGTKKNNRIFNSLFDPTTSVFDNSDAFNPHLITKAVLKEDGHTIFDGHLKLIDIKDKAGEISYNVNLFSKSVSLKSILGSKTFNDFDGGASGGGSGLQELLHQFTKAEIKKSWLGRLPITVPVPSGYTGYMTHLPTGSATSTKCTGGETTTNVLKYPFVQWNGGITQQSGGSQNSWPVLNEMPNAFRPWIRIKYLFDRILGEAGFTYQSDFIDGTGNYANPQGYANNVRKYPDFQRLFMDFNWGSKNTPGNFGDTQEISYTRDNASSTNYITPANTWVNIRFSDGEDALVAHGWNAVDNQFVCPQDNWLYTIHYSVKIYNNNASGDHYNIKLARYNSSGGHEEDISGHWGNTPGSQSVITFSGGNSTIAQKDDVIKLICKKLAPNPGLNGDIRQGDPSNTNEVTGTLSVSIEPLDMDSNTLLLKRGKIKQWDFIKDIMTMFNLYILQDKDDHTKLKIESYDDIFIDNEHTTNINQVTHDWTDRVDINEMEMKPMKLKKEASWRFKEEKKDYAHGVYFGATGDLFGNSGITTSATVPTGEEKIALKVFASTFCKPLFSNFAAVLTVPQILTQQASGVIEGFENTPRILYDVSGDQTTAGVGTSNLPQLPIANSVQKTYQFPSFHGVTGEAQSRFCQFLHVSDIPTSSSVRDFNFGTMQLVTSMTGAGGSNTTRNIFNEYWAPYYDELYHSDTMSVKIKVLLTPQEMAIINFYDKVMVKNREYRINKIDYKSNELSTVELILLP